MRKRLTQKQEMFCIKYFELGNAGEAARLAKYSPRTADVIGRENLQKLTIQARLAELRQEIKSAAVMNVEERMERLTEISRARLTDFMTAGADGSWVDIGPENAHSGALQEITSRTEYDDKGAGAAVITRVKLHNPIQAIDLLNKMDKIYSDGYQDNRVVNRVVNVFVIDNETKVLISRVGERTKLIGHENDQSIQGSPRSMGTGQETD